MDTCPVCLTPGSRFDGAGDRYVGTCPGCGHFAISKSAFEQIDKTNRHAVSGWIHDQTRMGDEEPYVDTAKLTSISQLVPLRFHEKILRFLREIKYGRRTSADDIDFAEPRFLAAIHARGPKEVSQIYNMLVSKGYATRRSSTNTWVITADGQIYIEEMLGEQIASAQGFVAMWFDDRMKPIWENGFEPAIRGAGYRPFRVDRHDHVNRIDDEIIAQIRRSRFLVADFTEHRGGVYFEAGFALGLGRPVFWTIDKRHLPDLHFDTRQYNFIDWETADELKERLRNRIEAVLGDGPVRP